MTQQIRLLAKESSKVACAWKTGDAEEREIIL